MGKIYSVGMTKNHFDVAQEHGRTPFYVDAKHGGDNIDDKNPMYNEITALYYLRKQHCKWSGWPFRHPAGLAIIKGGHYDK